jgi:uncharacterized protein YacL
MMNDGKKAAARRTLDLVNRILEFSNQSLHNENADFHEI